MFAENRESFYTFFFQKPIRKIQLNFHRHSTPIKRAFYKGVIMRLWYKGFISVLPRFQLLGQWRECCLIAKSISEKGTPNHLLVNKIMDYPLNHFLYYGRQVETEMCKRDYHVNGDNFDKWFRDNEGAVPYPYPKWEELFQNWHNEEYRQICYWNLKEKYLCGGITKEEWTPIAEYMKDVLPIPIL